MIVLAKESEKIWKHPMLWGLVLMFFLLNLWSIYGTVGSAGRQQWREWHRISREGTWESSEVEYAAHLYEDLNMSDVKEMKELHSNYEPQGIFREFVDACYRFFDGRVQEIRNNGETLGQYYPGAYLELHNYLYGELLGGVWLQMGALVCAAVIFLMDYERIAKTTDLVYGSAKGRGIQGWKMLLGIVYGMMAGIILLAATLGAYFSVVPMEGMWDVPVTAPLVANVRAVWLYPFITYEPMTVGEYLESALILGCFMVLGVGILAGVTQFLSKKGYFSITILLLLALGMQAVARISTGTFWDVFFRMNPAGLWTNSGVWFMEWDLILCFQGNEILSLILQYLVCTACLAVGLHRWNKCDL